MHAAAILEHGNGLAHAPFRFEKAQQHDGVGDVGDIEVGRHRAHQPMLRIDEEGHHAPLAEIGEEFVHLEQQLLFLRHGGHIAVQAVDHDHADAAFLHLVPDARGKFAGRDFGRVDLLDRQAALIDMAGDIQAEGVGPGQQCADALVKFEQGAWFAPFAGGIEILQGDGGLARPGRSGDQRAGAAHRATAQQGVEFHNFALHHVAGEIAMMIGGDQAGEDIHAALADHHVMIAGGEVYAAQFLHLHAPARRAKVQRQPFQRDDAMAQAVQMGVARVGRSGHVVDQDDGAVPAGEELLQGQNLTTIAQRILRQQAHFGQAVEHDAGRADPLHFVLDQADGFAQLHFPRVDDGLFATIAEHVIGGFQFEHVEAIERPVMGRGDGAQFLAGFGQGDVQNPLALADALAQKLQRERGLARSRRAFQQIETTGGDAAAQYLVQAHIAGRNDLEVHLMSRLSSMPDTLDCPMENRSESSGRRARLQEVGSYCDDVAALVDLDQP